MSKTKWLLVVLVLGTILFASCAGVDIKYSNAAYLEQQLKEIPPQLLKSRLVLNEESQSLFEPSFTIAEYIVYMTASRSLEADSWITLNVNAKEEGSVITLKKYARGDLVTVVTMNLTYQNNFTESRVDMITWDDRRLGEKIELVTMEEKLSYALLTAAFIIVQ